MLTYFFSFRDSKETKQKQQQFTVFHRFFRGSETYKRTFPIRHL